MKKTKYRIRTMFIALLAVITMVVPAMLQQPTEAVSRKTPSRVTVTGVKLSDNNKVTVTWKKAKNVTSYRVYYKQAGGKWKALANVGGTKYTHTSSKKYPLTAGKKYQYTVRAYNRYSRRWGSYDTKGRAVTIPLVPGTVKVKNVHAKILLRTASHRSHCNS